MGRRAKASSHVAPPVGPPAHMNNAFVSLLEGGDRRSIGHADLVVAQLLRQPARFDELWCCLGHDDPLVRMRAADALEKVNRVCPEAFTVHKTHLLRRSFEDGSAEVRWHLITIASCLSLSPQEAEHFSFHLEHCLRHDPSKIVKVMALQAADRLKTVSPAVAARFARMLAFAGSSGWPSVIARARKLAGRRCGDPEVPL